MRPLGFPNGRMVSRDRPPYDITIALFLASLQIEAPQGSEAEEKKEPADAGRPVKKAEAAPKWAAVPSPRVHVGLSGKFCGFCF